MMVAGVYDMTYEGVHVEHLIITYFIDIIMRNSSDQSRAGPGAANKARVESESGEKKKRRDACAGSEMRGGGESRGAERYGEPDDS